MIMSPTLPLVRSAVISNCGRYRYLLTRQVGSGSRIATFIMLNPSTADATNDDPTIRRCIGFARQWGCGRLAVLNLFAVRATDPAGMKRADDPVGPDNPHWFSRTMRDCRKSLVVCAWGIHGGHMKQDLSVLGWLDEHGIKPLALGMTSEGYPKHPIYLPKTAELVPFVARTHPVARHRKRAGARPPALVPLD